MVEVNRPDRADRRQRGKSDPIDADTPPAPSWPAPRPPPRRAGGVVEAIRVLRVARARRGQGPHRRPQPTQRPDLTAPETVPARLAGHRPVQLRSGSRASGPATSATRRGRPRPHCAPSPADHDADRRDHQRDKRLAALTAHAAPAAARPYGVGPESAGQLLVTAGDNPDRLHSEAAFAALCGASPIPASSAARPTATASTAAATGKPTGPCTRSCSAECAATNPPAPTSTHEQGCGKTSKRSSAASNATSDPRDLHRPPSSPRPHRPEHLTSIGAPSS